VVLVANKSDQAEQRQVPFSEAVRLAERYSLRGVIETSAKEGLLNVDDCFYIPLIEAVERSKPAPKQ